MTGGIRRRQRRVTNGFTDVYDGKRYETLTDEQMYAEPISGYIERVD